MPNEFINLQIEKLIVHEIYSKNEDSTIRAPYYSSTIATIDSESREILQNRILQGIGRDSQCFDMEIENDTDTSVFHFMYDSLSTQARFISNSKRIVQKLSDSQFSRNIPGGIILIFLGKIGITRKRIFGIIKAETQSGFDKEEQNQQIVLKLIKSLILTPAQRLFKIGVFIEDIKDEINCDKGNFKVLVYDSNLQRPDLSNAANYFFNTFLGCKYAHTDKKKTSDFFYKTNKYLKDLKVDEETKLDYQTSLYSYLRIRRNENISIREYANEFLENALIDEYVGYMIDEGFSEQAFHKDLSLIDKKLKRKTYKFSTKVKILVPVSDDEINEDLILIGDKEKEYTNVKIKGDIELV